TRARKAGVRFVMASDMWSRYPGLTRGQASLRVLEGLQEDGVPPPEILRAATLTGADLLGWADRIGSLEAGEPAGLGAGGGDPLEGVAAVQKARFVMKGGVGVRDDGARRGGPRSEGRVARRFQDQRGDQKRDDDHDSDRDRRIAAGSRIVLELFGTTRQ